MGTLSTAITTEAEEVVKFTGGAFSEPVMQVGTLFSVVGFMASTQRDLGLVAFSIIAPHIAIVLFTQRRVNELLARRVHLLRSTTDEIATKDIETTEKEVLEDFDRIYEARRSIFK